MSDEGLTGVGRETSDEMEDFQFDCDQVIEQIGDAISVYNKFVDARGISKADKSNYKSIFIRFCNVMIGEADKLRDFKIGLTGDQCSSTTVAF